MAYSCVLLHSVLAAGRLAWLKDLAPIPFPSELWAMFAVASLLAGLLYVFMSHGGPWV